MLSRIDNGPHGDALFPERTQTSHLSLSGGSAPTQLGGRSYVWRARVPSWRIPMGSIMPRDSRDIELGMGEFLRDMRFRREFLLLRLHWEFGAGVVGGRAVLSIWNLALFFCLICIY